MFFCRGSLKCLKNFDDRDSGSAIDVMADLVSVTAMTRQTTVHLSEIFGRSWLDLPVFFFLASVIWDRFGFFYPKSHSWLCHMLGLIFLVREDLLEKSFRSLWRTTSSVFERVSRQLPWSVVSAGPFRGSDVEL